MTTDRPPNVNGPDSASGRDPASGDDLAGGDLASGHGSAGGRDSAGGGDSAGGPDPAGGRPVARRPLWIVTVLLLVAAGLLWGASRLPWGVAVPAAPVPLALLALAAIAGVLATSGWARPVVGVLVALAGVAAGWTAFDGGFTHGVGARALALVGALVLLGAGLVLVRSGHRMPKLGGSYRTPAAAKGNEPPDKELWRALSEGKDPTVE
jgi:hypothetical protein